MTNRTETDVIFFQLMSLKDRRSEFSFGIRLEQSCPTYYEGKEEKGNGNGNRTRPSEA